MANELIKKYIGKQCQVTMGAWGSQIKGTILDVQDQWIEVETNKGIQIVNTDVISNIKVLA